MIVYGANCSWWDDISAVATLPSGLPCCPHCSGVLYETSERKWWEGVDARTSATDPNYAKFIEWLRGKCFTEGWLAAYETWTEEQDNVHG